MTMTHEQAKQIVATGKWEIQEGDWVYFENEKYLVNQMNYEKKICRLGLTMIRANWGKLSDDLTLIPQEKHLLELLPDAIYPKTDNYAYQLHIVKYGDKYSIRYDSLKRCEFETGLQGFYEALTDAVMYCIENGYVKKEG